MSAKTEANLLKVDALFRQAASLIWNSLPTEKRKPEELEAETLRISMRVIENFSQDLAAFSSASPSTNVGKPWSASADDELRALHESGNSVEDLASYFGRTPNGVRARLVKLGLLDAGAFAPRFAA